MPRLNGKQTDATFYPINWNEIEDTVDKLTWEKLTSQFWIDTRMVPSNDLNDWSKLTEVEQNLYNKVFGGLTLLDTLQGEFGNESIKQDAITQHEVAVLTNIQFMEQVHAKSYSTIFSTLCSASKIKEIFQWTETNTALQRKAKRIRQIYAEGTPLEKKAASVMLESFLFYSGFYTPLYYMGQGKMINVAEIIRLIIRDEAVHGTYIGQKFRIGFDKLSEHEQEHIANFVYGLLIELYSDEIEYARELYDEIGWTEDVSLFIRYNGNKALMNLGFEPFFIGPNREPIGPDHINPIIMNGLSTTTSNMDFFSSIGNGYLLSDVEQMKDDDYDYVHKTRTISE